MAKFCELGVESDVVIGKGIGHGRFVRSPNTD